MTVYLCAHYSVFLFISSAIIQSGMSVHDTTALLVMHMPGMSSSHGCVWIASLQ